MGLRSLGALVVLLLRVEVQVTELGAIVVGQLDRALDTGLEDLGRVVNRELGIHAQQARNVGCSSDLFACSLLSL